APIGCVFEGRSPFVASTSAGGCSAPVVRPFRAAPLAAFAAPLPGPPSAEAFGVPLPLSLAAPLALPLVAPLDRPFERPLPLPFPLAPLSEEAPAMTGEPSACPASREDAGAASSASLDAVAWPSPTGTLTAAARGPTASGRTTMTTGSSISTTCSTGAAVA